MAATCACVCLQVWNGLPAAVTLACCVKCYMYHILYAACVWRLCGRLSGRLQLRVCAADGRHRNPGVPEHGAASTAQGGTCENVAPVAVPAGDPRPGAAQCAVCAAGDAARIDPVHGPGRPRGDTRGAVTHGLCGRRSACCLQRGPPGGSWAPAKAPPSQPKPPGGHCAGAGGATTAAWAGRHRDGSGRSRDGGRR